MSLMRFKKQTESKISHGKSIHQIWRNNGWNRAGHSELTIDLTAYVEALQREFEFPWFCPSQRACHTCKNEMCYFSVHTVPACLGEASLGRRVGQKNKYRSMGNRVVLEQLYWITIPREGVTTSCLVFVQGIKGQFRRHIIEHVNCPPAGVPFKPQSGVENRRQVILTLGRLTPIPPDIQHHPETI